MNCIVEVENPKGSKDVIGFILEAPTLVFGVEYDQSRDRVLFTVRNKLDRKRYVLATVAPYPSTGEITFFVSDLDRSGDPNLSIINALEGPGEKVFRGLSFQRYSKWLLKKFKP